MSSDSWIRGKVVRGNGFGRKLGFPTANIELENSEERPGDGIYACWVRLQPDSTYEVESGLMGAIHVGPRPAIGDETPMVEIHILNFEDRDLYEQTIEFQVVKKIREVEDFGSTEKLKSAIAADCEAVRTYLVSS